MPYKILSLDGGGSWAMIQAKVLKDIYGDINGDISGHELLQQFDMVIANSGGSMVLAAMCNNMLLSDIIKIFESKVEREEVFSYLTFAEKIKNFYALFIKWSHLGPKYSTDRKLEGLIKLLEGHQVPALQQGETSIVERYLDELPAIVGNEKLQIIIAGFDYYKRRVNFFRSNTNSRTNQFNGGKFYRVKLGHAIHASSNAPVNYFNKPATINISRLGAEDKRTTWFWDGGVSGFNNPVLAGVIEAITNQFIPVNDYRVLSIGTGTGDRAVIADCADSTDPHVKAIYDANKGNHLTEAGHSSGLINDVKELATSILMDPPDSATFIAYSILHPDLHNDGNLVRINPIMVPELGADLKYTCPDVYKNDPDGFSKLLDMDMDAIEDWQVELIKGLCDKYIVEHQPCVPNQLIRGNGDSKFLGDLNYKDAKAHWKRIAGL